MPEMISALPDLLLYATFTIAMVGSTMHPAILAGVAILCSMAFAGTVMLPFRWLLPWLLLGVVVVGAIYGLHQRKPEDWVGDFILLVGVAPYAAALILRLVIRIPSVLVKREGDFERL